MSVTGSEVELRQLSADALAHQNAGRFAEAAQSYAALLSRAPDAWVACYNLGLVYQHLQRLPEAAEMYARAVRINPNLAEGYNNLGNVLKALNNDSAAMESFEKALALNPQLSEAAYNLAFVLQSRDRLDDSIAALRAALAHGPLRDHAWDALYRALLGLGRQEEAITAFVEWESVTPLSPERVVAGLALCRPMGDRVREERYLSLAMAWPFEIFTPEQFAPVLGMLQYFDVSADTILRCYRRYDAAVTARQPPQVALLARRAADSRIRVGYLSGDFRQHVMGRLMLDVVARHDRTRFSILLISTCAKGQHDATTAEFQRCADGFADVSGLDDCAAAKSIGEADIDILVDLSGHTNSARPGIYAHRPARNIVTHLGYHGCLGMSAVDYKLTDRVADLDHAAGWQIEKPYFLDTGVFPFSRIEPAPVDTKIGTSLGLEGKFVFGAFLNLLKLSPRCLGVWARVLDALPEAVLLFSPLSATEKPAIARAVSSAGIDAARIAIVVVENTPAPLRARYRLVDAVMDSFPYAGGDTTLAALDMGVPVVTLAGQRHSERIGASILAHLGLDALIADSDDTFVAIAVRLARDADFMANIRQEVAVATEAAVDNADTYTRALESAFIHLATQKSPSKSMSLTARQFFTTLHDAMRRQVGAGNDKSRLEIAAIFAELRKEQPDYPPLLRAQGQLAQDMKNLPLATECIEALLQQFPDDIDARLNLAGILIAQGAANDALMVLDDASGATVVNPRVLGLQVRAHGQLRQWNTARRFSDAAMRIAPTDVEAIFWHGTVLSHTGEIESALLHFNRALILAPENAAAAYNAGVLLGELGNHTDAEKVFRRILGNAAGQQAHLRLLQNLKAQGRRSEWMRVADQYVAAYPASDHSRLLQSRNARFRGDLAREAELLLPLAEAATMRDVDAETVELIGELLSILPYHDISFRLIQRLHVRFVDALHATFPAFADDVPHMPNTSDDRLTLGYLVDFSLPFMSNLIIGLMRHHDRAQFEIVLYPVSPSDGIPQEVRNLPAVKVASLAAFDEFRAAEVIRADNVDVLIDASGFGTYAKPGVLSYRLAAFQIALPGLDRPGAMGCLDGRLSDRILDLVMESETEVVPPVPWRVDGCALPVLPAAMTAPSYSRIALGIQDGAPVFGVMAPVGNLSLRCAGLWNQLSIQIPDAVFFVCPTDENDIAAIKKILTNAGIDAARLYSMPMPATRVTDLTLTGLMDIILDTVPGSDYTSVRASILEGIPVVTMPGRMPAERVGTTLMTHLRLTSGIAQSGRDYVDIAARWASNPAERMRHSAHARTVWREASQTGAPFSMEAYTSRIEAAVIGTTTLRAIGERAVKGK